MPKTIHDELVEEILARNGQKNAQFNSGIITADRYLQTLSECVGSDLCYRFASKGNVSFNDQMIKAAKTLTYNNEDMEVQDQVDFTKGFNVEDMYGVPLELPKNCLMVFKHTLTSPRKDRDGDILRTQGARPDPKMLMLFQHTHTLPIGKMLGIAAHTKNTLDLYSSIVDMNELSHDSAVMIDNKMGRFSHGFRALDFTKVKEDDGNGRTTSPGGFDIKEFEIMEESLVSVPSNTDANTQEVILSLVESKKMTSLLMKGYGKKIREKRPLSLNIPGSFPIDLNITVNGKSITAKENKDHETEDIESGSEKTAVGTGRKCGCGCNGAPGGCGGKKPTPTETHEHDESTEKAAADNEVVCPECGAKMSGGMCPKCGYGKTDTKETVEGEKSGRVISSSNMGKLKQAKDHLKDLHTAEPMMSQGGKARCQAAHGLIKEVIDAAPTPNSDTERSAEITVKGAMSFFISNSNDADKEKMMGILNTMKSIQVRDKKAATLKSLRR